MAEHVATKASIIVPLWSHPFNPVLVHVTEPKDVAVASLGMNSMCAMNLASTEIFTDCYLFVSMQDPLATENEET